MRNWRELACVRAWDLAVGTTVSAFPGWVQVAGRLQRFRCCCWQPYFSDHVIRWPLVLRADSAESKVAAAILPRRASRCGVPCSGMGFLAGVAHQCAAG